MTARDPLGPLVLEYHAVSDTWHGALAVSPAEFRRQIEWLVRRGYSGATFSDAAASGTSRTFAVTFDDAYRSVFRQAYPILASLGVPGTVFVVTDYAKDGRPLTWPGGEPARERASEDDLLGMTWEELRRVAADGWEVGSHTQTHPRLTELPDEELDRELRGSREACERALGAPCHSLAYPFGDADRRVLARAAEAGYEVAAIEDPAPPEPLRWPRVGIYRADGLLRFRLKASPLVRRLRSRFGEGRTVGR